MHGVPADSLGTSGASDADSLAVVAAQVPASGPHLRAALEAANRAADLISDRERKFEGEVSANCRLFQELLRQSAPSPEEDAVPMLTRADLCVALDINLSGRRWDSFLRWFNKDAHERLLSVSEGLGAKVLYPARASDRCGGYSRYCQAKYFLTFSSPNSFALEDNASPAHPAGPVSTQVMFEELERELHALREDRTRLARMLGEAKLEIDRLTQNAAGT
jgi:hypothetical protein